MASVNKVILIGRLGRDPESRVTTSGKSVCTFSFATNRISKNEQGEKVEETEWHSIVAYGQVADICAKYLKKGGQAYIEGSLRTREFTGKDNVRRWKTEVIVHSIQIVDYARADQATAPAPAQRPTATAAQPSPDEIPF